jgi:hypothetical protein
MTPRSCLKTLVVALGFVVPWLLLQAAWVPPAAAQDIVVSAADPPTAPQGTVNLDVKITGKNFKRGAVSRFLVTGTQNPGGVAVNRTTFVRSTELRANVTITDTATLSKFDIEVQNSDGRTGKGIELFTVTAKLPQNTFATADFPDSAADRIRSDGQLLPQQCLPGDYADYNDPCGPGCRVVSYVMAGWTYFLRTVSDQVPDPERWLVLDFSVPLPGSACPGIDTKLSDYPGRNPAVSSPPVDPDDCIDLVEVRFFADKAFAPGAEYSPVSLVIDGPDASTIQSTGVQWNAKYYLDFVNPLRITRSGPAAVTLETMDGLEQAQLWTVNPKTGKRQKLLGTYSMPFQVTIAARP